MTTTKITFSGETLAQNLAYWKTRDEVVAAGFTFTHGTPQVGEQAVIYSRNNWRLGLVSHVTKTGTVSVQYVTPGGITEGEQIVAQNQSADVEAAVRSARAATQGNYEYSQRRAAGTDPLFAKYPEQYTPERIAKERADAQAILDSATLEERLIEAEERARRRHSEALAKGVFDYVNVTTKTSKDVALRVQG